MCGIAGLLVPARDRSSQALQATAVAMSGALRHRGPDDEGAWVDAEAGVALGHRRLAVVDLSPAGAQPMISADGHLVLSFNGEIYNHRDLRRRLEQEGQPFRGMSDTEVLLAALSRWGVEAALRAAEGMFALALWDRRRRVLTLARDRLGEKPLYLCWTRDTFAFASELAALRPVPGFAADLDAASVGDLLRLACIPAPHTIYRGVEKLRPGHLLEVDVGTPVGELRSRPYWQLSAVAQAGTATPITDEAAALAALDEAVVRSVGEQMTADVPVGCFLSGGVDSSLVTAVAQELSSRPVRTFSIGFEEAAWDEAPHARAVARHLGTEHVEHYVSGQEALDVVPEMARVYDEPFADSSQIPTLLVSRLARSQVTVALSGDGGDELFRGYDRYRLGDRLATLARVPRPLRSAAAAAVLAVPSRRWDAVAGYAARVLPAARVARAGDKAHKAARLLQADSAEVYATLVASGSQTGLLREDAWHPDGVLVPAAVQGGRALQYLDQVRYLPDDLLVKVDRAAMSVGLETRVPLLSPRVLALSWRLPDDLLISAGQGKQPLRRLLAARVPPALTDRPKQGFAVPLGPWLRGPLREWARDLTTDAALARDGLFAPQRVREALAAHDSGHSDLSATLWPVLAFQAWREVHG